MTKQTHFIVTYNHETREFNYDVEETLAKFGSEWVWNDETNKWEDLKLPENEGFVQDGEDALIVALNEHGLKLLGENHG